ncbi:MAG: DUF2092 domain-containing protein [Acidobacteriota bacterium]|nr:MAG: DUF2092 domain-containing protein [Acidobacteriota bacterium]
MCTRMTMTLMLLAVLLTCPIVATAQSEPIDERAKTIINEMSQLLAETPSYAFRTEQTLDEVLDSGLKAQFAGSRTVAISKPDRAAGHADGDLLSAAFWYDGETMTVLDERHFSYVQVEVPGTLDAALDFLEEEFEIVMPLADFASDDVYAALTQGAEYMIYLGIHRVGERRCHHLALANEWLEWQIWVDAEGDPLPCKILINYMDEPGEPQFTAVFHSWNLKPELSDELFRFEPPEGAERMEARGLQTLVDPEPSDAKVNK